jgi:hypothetical protein
MLGYFGSGRSRGQTCKWRIEWDTCAPGLGQIFRRVWKSAAASGSLSARESNCVPPSFGPTQTALRAKDRGRNASLADYREPAM